MALHHRREMPDMRSIYYQQNETTRHRSPASSGSDSDRSYKSGSIKSYSTAPTSYSGSTSRRPPQVRWDAQQTRRHDVAQRFFDDRQMQESPPSSPASSVETYASTVDSEEDVPDDMPQYDVPVHTTDSLKSSAIPTIPEEFTQLFPSALELDIRHDDSTIDGNMNLRVDTKVWKDGQDYEMTLFHLRLHDLKHREFSLRRYCRNSGREVCHSVRKRPNSTMAKRPGFQRSLSNALQSMRPKSERRSSTAPNLASLKRNDSGYGSMHSVDFDEEYRPGSAGHDSQVDEVVDRNSVKLEFSNYAQVEVRRGGTKGNKRYSFEYWGVPYAWKRVIRKDDGKKQVAFHLVTVANNKSVAYIEPVKLGADEALEERKRGGWIPPCSMRIVDESIVRSRRDRVDESGGQEDKRRKDVADVVVATGLVALVDNSIRSHFHAEDSKQLLIPVPKFNVGVEYIGPRRLINEMFNKSQSRPSSSNGRPTSAGSSTAGAMRPSASRRQTSREQR